MSTFGCQFWGFQPGYSLWKPRADLAWPLQLLLHVWPCFLHLIENPSNIVEYSRQPQLNKIMFQSQILEILFFFPEGGSSPWILQSRGVQGVPGPRPKESSASNSAALDLLSMARDRLNKAFLRRGLRSSHYSWHWVCHIRNVDDWFWRIFSYSEILWRYLEQCEPRTKEMMLFQYFWWKLCAGGSWMGIPQPQWERNRPTYGTIRNKLWSCMTSMATFLIPDGFNLMFIFVWQVLGWDDDDTSCVFHTVGMPVKIKGFCGFSL